MKLETKNKARPGFTTTGIVLRQNGLGENDRWITVLTADRGKLTCIAKGVRSVKSRRNPHLELLNRVKLELWKSAHHHYLTAATAEERFSELKREMPSLSSAAFMAEATDRLVEKDQNHPELFALLSEGLELMNFYPEKHALLREGYLVKLLKLLGLLPSFRTCSRCQGKLPAQTAYLDPVQNTLQCKPCARPEIALEPLSLDQLKFLAFMADYPLSESLKLKIHPEHLETLAAYGRRFLYHHHPKRLHSETALLTYV